VAEYLIDKSAFARMHSPAVKVRLEPMILSGSVAITGVAMIEVLFSAQGLDDYRIQRSVLDAMPRVEVSGAIVERALDVQELMAGSGTHRSAFVPDLLIAACAEANGLTVLHYDADYEVISRVTGQRTEWIVPAGTA
jgi:predicted nucleic acid-binding protein